MAGSRLLAHVHPFADGGPATVENIQLRCRAHNQYESEQWFGTADPSNERGLFGVHWLHNSVRTELIASGRSRFALQSLNG